MISGTGIDIIEIERIEKAIERWGDGFLTHVFTDNEIAYAKEHRFPAQHYAARFAAKEAVLKAFGDNAHISWKDIQITNDKNGKPVCTYRDKSFKKKILISISHTHVYAVASAIITP
ncbi:MAG TPA: holo-ACP synthase [Candidatus Omnitrophota bacterium]|nr:holo-ACP synthase [Candidatus Omnitrophota bacterium]HPD85257.1 holo-ACP synthase [Candidatus Omnitrophota bacterium]HRZ04242.1 holo-ACP synthase [Candidatus Omnitrophota bacterium]